MVDLVIDARSKSVGGIPVGRVLPIAVRRHVGPFVFLDHMGPADLVPGQGLDVRPHPHIGLSTVTYLFEGEILHRDNLGFTQAIRPAEVNWMTAGRGIVHSERTDPGLRATGGRMHGLQAWVALPAEDEEIEPSFVHHDAGDLPAWEEDGVRGRLVAGTAFGLVSGVRVSSPLFYVHQELVAGARTSVPSGHEERAIYVVRGRVEVGGHVCDAGRMLVFSPGSDPVIVAATDASLVMLGGAPLGERFIWWNFVSSRRERIEEAKADWASGRMPLPPTDASEAIPLPSEPKPPEPMS